ncbi:MAG: hypothetical protein IJT36_09475 [Alphaproteobacteria bacterium]|nr:hypothetical protein [Alphaproteobacteria bacterium]
MPQLAVETFPSQIFWVLIGFFAVYVFMSTVIAPKIEKTLENRSSHIGSLVKRAEQLENDAKIIEKNALDALERAEVDATTAESKLIASFREQSIKEKEALYEVFSKQSRSKSKLLSEEAEKCFADISNDMDDIISTAIHKINGSSILNKKRG